MKEDNHTKRLEALRRFCYDCLPNLNCTHAKCPFFFIREPKRYYINSKGLPNRHGTRWLRGEIRKKCLECCGGSAGEVRLCLSKSCGLWIWRTGSCLPFKEDDKLSEAEKMWDELFHGPIVDKDINEDEDEWNKIFE